jgi:hypothetical protein
MRLDKIKFSRLKEFDERSRNYPIMALIPKGSKPRSYTWRCDLNLDQKNLPACVGFSWTHEAAARPYPVNGLNDAIAVGVYRRAQKLDDVPGENYEGTSVLGGAKAAEEKKWLKEYRWGFSESDLCLAVGYHGPAVLGINWYSGMMNPDSKGIVRPTGTLEGGHAILCNGVNVKNELYRLHNSWSSSWGINGDCFITRADMTKLLKEQGETCIPVVRLMG